MSKTKNGILVSVSIIAIAGGLWFLFHTKRHYARVISQSGYGSNFVILMTFDTAYLKEWAKAIRKNQNTFTYLNKKYTTETGKVAN